MATRKSCLHAAAACGLIVAASAHAADSYAIDPIHSMPEFSFKHLNLSKFRGRFEKTTGTIKLDPANHSGGADVVIDVDSVSSGFAPLDKFLKSADFFDAAKFPAITFKSSAFAFDADRLVSVSGDLVMHGVTRPVVLKVSHFACLQHPLLKVPSCGADASATIKRSDFGLGAFIPNDSDEVDLDISVEALQIK